MQESIDYIVVINVLVGVSKMLDEVKVAKETKAPVHKREDKKDAWHNLLF